MELSWIDGEKYKLQKEIPHKKCADDDTNETSDFVKESGLICITEFDEDAVLKGNYYADEFSYIQIIFELC